MKKIKGKEVFLITAIFLICLYAMAYYLCPEIQEDINRFNQNLENFAKTHGYWGGFLVSFFGAATIFVVIPYPAIILILVSAGLNIWLLAFLAGLGAGLGEITSYLIGYGSGRMADRHYSERFEGVRKIIEKKPKLVPALIFLFGLTPLPDDIIFIPLGFVRYSFRKAFIPGFLGKLSMLLIVCFFGQQILDLFNIEAFGTSGIGGQIITLVLTVAIMYAVLKINWNKLIQSNE